jgi:hypothetical protein
MNHLKPISKASMQWFDPNPLDKVKIALSFVQALAPVVDALIGSKRVAVS